MNLQELQTNFQNIILDKECTGADWVSESAQEMSSEERLAIYHNAYRVRLIDVLLDTFEHTAIYLGDEWFTHLASDYVQSHHSTVNNIGLYGRDFSSFLKTQLADDLEVAELASLDWKLRRAFDGGDCHIMTLEHLQQLAGIEPQLTQLQLIPTLSVVTQNFNTLDIWHAINLNENPPLVESLPEPVDILIWRKGHSPHFRSISEIESFAISCVLRGDNLEEIGAELQAKYPELDAVTEFGCMLHRWIDEQILAFEA